MRSQAKNLQQCVATFFVLFRIISFFFFYSHHPHVILRLQRDFQHFSPVDHPLQAGRGDSLPSDAMDLVEGVGLQEPLVCRPDENLQPQWSRAVVPNKLWKATELFTLHAFYSARLTFETHQVSEVMISQLLKPAEQEPYFACYICLA